MDRVLISPQPMKIAQRMSSEKSWKRCLANVFCSSPGADIDKWAGVVAAVNIERI